MELSFGVSYYPELVDENEWARDLALMRDTGLTVIRMLDFAWTAIEPKESCYEFDWLDRFLDLASANGMKVILCTPTATPPAWLAGQYPEVMAMGHDGARYPWGTRRNVCVNTRTYRHYSAALAEKLGERYGHHPAVSGWQIDNELIGPEAYAPECHCPECVFLFRQWVKARYGSVVSVNKAWGLRFWNQELGAWGELDTPRNRHAVAGHVLEHARFFNASVVDYIRLQRDALRRNISESQFITHNSTGVFDRCLDHLDFAAELDYAAWDAYVGAAGNRHPLGEAFTGLANDLFRGAKHKPFLILETNTDDTAYLAYWAEAVARGCGMLLFWHWRRHRANAENRCPALCDYAGKPYPGRLGKIKDFIAKIKPLATVPDEFRKTDAALLYSQDGVRVDHRSAKRPIPYLDALVRLYQPFWRLGVPLDVLRPGDSLEGRKLVVMPCLRLLDASRVETLKEFVRRGGVLLASAKTAHLDEHGVYYPELGGPLRELLGIELVEAELDGAKSVVMADGSEFPVEGQAEEARVGTAEILGCFNGDKAKPAVFANQFCDGKVYYMACVSAPLALVLAKRALKDAGMEFAESPDALACSVPDFAGRGRWLINHSDKPVIFGGDTVPPKCFAVAPGCRTRN